MRRSRDTVRRSVRLVLAVTTAIVAGATAASAAPGPDGPDGTALRVPISGSRPGWLAHARKIGHVDPRAVRTIRVVLAPYHPDIAEQTAYQVSTPGSPRYRAFLTAQQWSELVGPTQATVQRVRGWLRSAGLALPVANGPATDRTPTNPSVVTATGTTATIEKAFGLHLDLYRYGSRTLVAPDADPQVPGGLRPAITAVLGLDDTGLLITPAVAPAAAAAPTPDPTTVHAEASARGRQNLTGCASAWGSVNNTTVPQRYPTGRQSNRLCGDTPQQLRGIYHLSTRDTGAGQRIGLVGACSNTRAENDANTWARAFGIPALSTGQYRTADPSNGREAGCDAPGWAAAQTQAIEAVRALAPSAGITWYGSPDSSTVDEALERAVTDNTVSIISIGWTAPESLYSTAFRNYVDQVLQQAAAQGQTVLAAAGDTSTSRGLGDKPQPTFPASSPWITAVGGTTVGADVTGHTVFTAGWKPGLEVERGTDWARADDHGQPFVEGTAGGASQLYRQPDYQRTFSPSGQRHSPDIAMLADPNTGAQFGMTLPEGYRFLAAGGTALATVLLAATVADALQDRDVLDAISGNTQRAGFLNPTLYSLTNSVDRAPPVDAIDDVIPVSAGIWTPAAAPSTTPPAGAGTGTSYLIDVDNQTHASSSTPGWDVVTGVGTPGPGFLDALRNPYRVSARGLASILPTGGESIWHWLWHVLTSTPADDTKRADADAPTSDPGGTGTGAAPTNVHESLPPHAVFDQ